MNPTEVVLAFHERASRRDESALDLIAEDFIQHAAGPQGRDGFRQTVETLRHDLDEPTTSIHRVIAQDDVVVDQTPERIQMLGALRAGKTCLECHEGQRGKLLGAFSYELTPIATPPNKGETPSPEPARPHPTSETPNYM